MLIPETRHWFSNSALLIILTFIPAMFMSLWGLQDDFTWLGNIVAVVASQIVIFFVWREAAVKDFMVTLQAEREDLLNNTVSELTSAIRDLADQRPSAVGKADIPKQELDVKKLTNQQICAEASRIAMQMKSMEARFREFPLTPRLPNEDYNATSRRLSNQSDERRRRWLLDLRPQALTIWEELQRRVYGSPPYPEDADVLVALEYGMLAGVRPLGSAADAIERMAKHLVIENSVIFARR